DQYAIDGRHSQRLKTEHRAFAAGDVFGRGDHLQVFDADTVRASFVVAGFVRDDHAGLKWHGVEHFRDAMRTFVHAEIRTDAVAGAVIVVEAGLPQAHPRQRVKLVATGALWKAYARERDMAFQHAREAILHLRRRAADGDGSRDVGGAIEILAAAINE